ncbi:MAG TPA: hypothetical protein VHD36_20020 [Pirellulales bacterium]|nr:hypothetical protein [Pirellulales bacterium]HWB09178.1 hypothetical protein [Pirellulales bacterium]
MARKPHSDREPDNPGVTIGTWLLVLAPMIFAAVAIAAIAVGALPKVKLSFWIFLGLFVALVVAIVAFIVRCVRLYLRWNRVPDDDD